MFHNASWRSFQLHSLTVLAESLSEIAMPKKPSQPKAPKISASPELPAEAWHFGPYFQDEYEGETLTMDHWSALYMWEFQKEKLCKDTLDEFKETQRALCGVIKDFHSLNPKQPRLPCPAEMAFNPLSPALRNTSFNPLTAFRVRTLTNKHFLQLRKKIRSLLVESITLQNQLASKTLEKERSYLNPSMNLFVGLKSLDEFNHVVATNEGITYLQSLTETGYSLALFRVPWSLEDAELINLFTTQFAAWLKANRKAEFKKQDRRGKSERRSMESELNALGDARRNRAKKHASNKTSTRTSKLSLSQKKTSDIKNLSRSLKKSAGAIEKFDLCHHEHIRAARVKVENQARAAKPAKK